MGFKTTFRNLGHYFAVGAKAVATGVSDVILYANKAQTLEPEVDAVVGAIAGPIGERFSQLSFYAFGELAKIIKPVGDDAASIAAVQSQLSSVGLNFDVQTINDIKSAVAQIEALYGALKVQKPA